MRLICILLLLGLLLGASSVNNAAQNEEQLSRYVIPPLVLGTLDETLPIWTVLNSGGALVGYIFETRELTPLPGFSGTPMNLLVTIDTNGSFLDVNILDQNEPVFVSGLGERPFHEFVSQYRGNSLASNIKVLLAKAKRSSKAESGTNTYIDGVTKATASVRIANETILASALKVAREKLANIAPKPTRRPRQDLFKTMNWQQLVDSGLLKNLRRSNRDVQYVFSNTRFVDDDPVAVDDPNGLFIDLWIADLGLPSVAKNILDASSLKVLKQQLSETEEPILILANGRHQLVAEDFVRNSVPDRMAMAQQHFPISLRDADAEIAFLPTVPEFDQAMILRVDTRYGFDPSSSWDFTVKVLRTHGHFQPDVGSQDFTLTHKLDEQYFEELKEDGQKIPYWLLPWIEKTPELVLLILFLCLLGYYLATHRRTITIPHRLASIRFSLLTVTLIYVGWMEQGQLSIVTVLGFLRAIFLTHNFSFLLYDPISLVLWIYVLVTLIIWGRGTFCGWLCPFGAIQEFAFQLGQKLGIKEINLSHSLAQKLASIKYMILVALVGSVFISSSLSDKLVEIEPFKTTITLTFERTWPYVVYALICIFSSMLVFKGYCRFLCPLGAVLALGSKLRTRDWLVRREACGNPCKLCFVVCRYDAIIRNDGSIKYDDCFQCLECVEIYDDKNRCVPLIQENKI